MVGDACGLGGPVDTPSVDRPAGSVSSKAETIHQAAKRLRHRDIRVTETCYAINTSTADIDRMRISALMANLAR